MISANAEAGRRRVFLQTPTIFVDVAEGRIRAPRTFGAEVEGLCGEDKV